MTSKRSAPRSPEGPRLDYKAEIPKELQKVVAAFANTLGGIILLGIEANRATNRPVWPPKGMQKVTGIEKRYGDLPR